MPNNCSTLIQRKQHILHKILRSNSEGKLQHAVAETTAPLRVSGTRKIPNYSTSVHHHPNHGLPAPPIPRRSTLFTTNRVQPTNDHHTYGTHLPSIRDASGPVTDRQQPQQTLYDDSQPRSRPKTPVTTASPKSTGYPPSASMSSIYNTLTKRSNENLNNDNDDFVQPQSRQSRQASNESSKYGMGTNAQTPPKHQKHSGDNGTDSRYSLSPVDLNQQRGLNSTNKYQSNGYETLTRERTNPGQLYQRRTNNNYKTPIKQKIDKYRRRSEETTQATNGNPTPTSTSPASIRQKASPTNLTSAVRRVPSDSEVKARLEVLRLSMDPNLIQIDQQQQQNIRHPMKSPTLYTTHQQLAQPTPAHMPSILVRRNQPINSSTNSQHRQNYQRQGYQQQPTSSMKHLNSSMHGNLYLAFIASRHLSTVEDALVECDIDHSKLLRIFSWLKNVEEHRHEQTDHEKLLFEQNQRMLNEEENLSLYSEIQYAVDDLPANTSGKPCERIPPMQFDD